MAPPQERDPLVGTLVGGRYRIRALLGEGGMGQVYLAVHEAIEKKVALKVLRPQLSSKRDIVTRFQQEAISASRIKHPNVLDVFDFGQLDNGCFFLAMELLEGHDLSEELAQGQPLPPARAVAIGLQVSRALGAAHAAGVVHRDLKPENVFLQRRPDGTEEVKLVDFGIAQLRSADDAAQSQPRRRRLTRTGMIFGTPEYMAPEQAAGLSADRATHGPRMCTIAGRARDEGCPGSPSIAGKLDLHISANPAGGPVDCLGTAQGPGLTTVR